MAVKNKVIHLFPQAEIIFHSSNSGGTIGYPQGLFDMIRPGIACYEYPEGENALGLDSVMEISSYVSLIKVYDEGDTLGYGRTYTTGKNERVGVVPVGYGDGLFRCLSNVFMPFVNGFRQRSIGRISIDQFTVSLDESTQEGDRVILLGKGNDAKDIALQAGTISYEVLCSFGSGVRCSREYEE